MHSNGHRKTEEEVSRIVPAAISLATGGAAIGSAFGGPVGTFAGAIAGAVAGATISHLNHGGPHYRGKN